MDDLESLDEGRFDRSTRRHDREAWTGAYPRGVVATAHYRASDAGAEILSRGGNAIDAAVAASLALGVCESAGSGLGGMAMMLVHHASSKKTVVIEGACRAPRLATPEAVKTSHRYRGHRAVAVPMNVAVLRHALSRYGTLSEAEVLAPAIRLAREGFRVTTLQNRNFTQYQSALQGRSGAGLFLDQNGQPPETGSLFRQAVLASALDRLAKHGMEDFYRGEIAREIAADLQKNGGFVSSADLHDALLPRELDPLTCPWNGGEVRVAGPPAGGLSLVQLLNLDTAWGGIDPDTPSGVVRLSKAIQRSRLDRQRVRLNIGSLSLDGASGLATPSYGMTVKEELDGSSGETSHVSVLDRDGNAVGLTQSIERCFGSAEASPDLGFLYNGYLRGFKVENKRHPHFLQPGAVARSNAAPTLFLKQNRPEIVLGSTGSERMISGIFETLLRLGSKDPFEAVEGPRLHCTPEGRVLWEGERFPDGCGKALEEAGFTLEQLDPYSFHMGGLQLATRLGDQWLGVADPRRDGSAGGA